MKLIEPAQLMLGTIQKSYGQEYADRFKTLLEAQIGELLAYEADMSQMMKNFTQLAALQTVMEAEGFSQSEISSIQLAALETMSGVKQSDELWEAIADQDVDEGKVLPENLRVDMEKRLGLDEFYKKLDISLNDWPERNE